MPDLLFVGVIALGLCMTVLIILMGQQNRSRDIAHRLASLEKYQERSEAAVKDEIARNRAETAAAGRALRQEIAAALTSFNESVLARLNENATTQLAQLEAYARQLNRLTQSNEDRLEKMRATLESRLHLIQEDNAKRLEEMRATVDEKLHATLEKRLGESFKIVSERLELVHKGLGEMQALAAGVGDLKRVLTNVKARGIWGEIHLGSLLEQILTPEQYAVNVATKPGSSERVEFAVKLPGRDINGSNIWLPIDAKFPQEDYQRLLDAHDRADPVLAEEAGKCLENRIKLEAKAIAAKYIGPPATTDFAVLFLPVEGLYAEVLRRPGLYDILLRDYRVVVSGPTTLAAFLNSLQMGFRTLAVEKRSSEVWELLGAVKTEFGKFGTLLEQTHKKLQAASSSIETAARKSRTIERKLKGVEVLSPGEAVELLGEWPGESETDEGE
ncbi:MAG TPA: DNA recombination protein RmuC [Methylomusa anaerophila]|uniref:RmuC family protein n=1 Tax=Methylomusa anaerophila TaxID=1930071 RepID=A0A348AHM8_9FIRM|nr:DNA recombination protein RmuC [Methylomusa anaerophila]BBB90576.1 RmuC family protein [Methylomusa anaerophila]HML88817.1 DNA recombination protein RmuC [Methylomusa anaerophila]